jgi:hypothetical protein
MGCRFIVFPQNLKGFCPRHYNKDKFNLESPLLLIIPLHKKHQGYQRRKDEIKILYLMNNEALMGDLFSLVLRKNANSCISLQTCAKYSCESEVRP